MYAVLLFVAVACPPGQRGPAVDPYAFRDDNAYRGRARYMLDLEFTVRPRLRRVPEFDAYAPPAYAPPRRPCYGDGYSPAVGGYTVPYNGNGNGGYYRCVNGRCYPVAPPTRGAPLPPVGIRQSRP